MIRNKLKIIILVWPIILLFGVLGYFSYQRYQIDEKLLDADGLVWKAGENQFSVQVNTREKGELLYIAIQVVDPDKKEIYKKNEVIDRDMFGGGFVRAAQVDQDFENEIIVWHAQAKYYLDFSEGNVREVSFDQAPQKIKDLAKDWHQYNVIAGLEMTILFIFVLGYYTIYILVNGIIRLFKRKRSK